MPAAPMATPMTVAAMPAAKMAAATEMATAMPATKVAAAMPTLGVSRSRRGGDVYGADNRTDYSQSAPGLPKNY